MTKTDPIGDLLTKPLFTVQTVGLSPKCGHSCVNEIGKDNETRFILNRYNRYNILSL